MTRFTAALIASLALVGPAQAKKCRLPTVDNAGTCGQVYNPTYRWLVPPPYQAHPTWEQTLESLIAVKTNHINVPCEGFQFQHGRCL